MCTIVGHVKARTTEAEILRAKLSAEPTADSGMTLKSADLTEWQLSFILWPGLIVTSVSRKK